MRKFSHNPHVADVRLHVEADSFAELLTAALEGMAELIVPGSLEQEATIKETIELSSGDATSLVIDFLSDVLTFSHMRRAVFTKVTFEELSENFIRATVVGVSCDSFEEDVKAVTYHEAHVFKNDAGNLETVIVFDI